MQPENFAEAQDPRWILPEGVPRRTALQHHRDRLENVLRPLRQSHGSRHHVRPGEEEIARIRVLVVRGRRISRPCHQRALYHAQRQAGGDQESRATRWIVQS